MDSCKIQVNFSKNSVAEVIFGFFWLWLFTLITTNKQTNTLLAKKRWLTGGCIHCDIYIVQLTA